jgi:hypothetical protein
MNDTTVIGGKGELPGSIAWRCGRCTRLVFVSPANSDRVRVGARVLCLRCAARETPNERVQLPPATIEELRTLIGDEQLGELIGATLDMTLAQLAEVYDR